MRVWTPPPDPGGFRYSLPSWILSEAMRIERPECPLAHIHPEQFGRYDPKRVMRAKATRSRRIRW